MRTRVLVGVLALLGIAAVALAAALLGERAPAPAASPPAPVPVARAIERAERDLHTIAGIVRAPDGAPLAGALACDHPAFDAPVTCAATSADGRFHLSAPAGHHKLQVIAPPGSSLVSKWFEDTDRSRDATPLDLRKADRIDIVIDLAAGRRVSGRTVAARDGAAVVDAIVCAAPVDEAAEWECRRTDGTGRYALVVRPARYQLFFVPPDETRLIPQWWDGAADVLGSSFLDVAARDATGIDAAFVEGFLISGTVRAAGSGEPVERALVCTDTPFPTGRICRPTDKEGRYSVAVRSGTFLVQFKPPAASRLVSEWHGGAPDWRTARQVVVRGDVRVDAELATGRMLWGIVRAVGTEVPLEGATVNVYDASRPCCVAIAAALVGIGGDYATVVRPGRYWVEVFPPTGTPYVSAFFGGPERERARAIEVKTNEDAAFIDVVLDEYRPPS